MTYSFITECQSLFNIKFRYGMSFSLYRHMMHQCILVLSGAILILWHSLEDILVFILQKSCVVHLDKSQPFLNCICDDEYHYLSCKEDGIVNTASSGMFCCRSVML